MPTYAQNTEVPADRSIGEIERTLERYGATAFMYGWDGGRAVISFEFDRRRYRIVIPLPNKGEFTVTDSGRARTSKQATQAAWEQAVRQRWRALALYIKAILEADEAGIISIEDALQTYTVMPNGKTLGEWIAPQIEEYYRTGKMPPLLPGPRPENLVDGQIMDG